MGSFDPDTYCGIYCGACSVVMHGSTGHTDAFAACLASVPRKAMTCGGCKSDSVYGGCGTCRVRHCARKKGVAHCVDCAEYPCTIYTRWQTLAKLVGHAREAPVSLDAIKRDGVEAWLAAQKLRWSCPDCGTPFSWYASECHQCGRPLSSRAYALHGWRKLVCRIVLPMAYRKGRSQAPAAD